MPRRDGHVLHECSATECYVCRGGLAWCTVCNGAEGSLPNQCPGRPMNVAEQDAVYAGKLAFIRCWRVWGRNYTEAV